MTYTIEFYINYQVSQGDTLAVEFSHSFNHEGKKECILLHSDEGRVWHACTDFIVSKHDECTYRYLVLHDKNVSIAEKAFPPRKLCHSRKNTHIVLYDTWRWDVNQLNLGSCAFTSCVFNSNKLKCKQQKVAENSITFKIHALPVEQMGCHLVIVGSCNALGAWNVQKGIPLVRINEYEYGAVLPSTKNLANTQYKYVLVSNNDEHIVWECGDNRSLSIIPSDESVFYANDGWIRIDRLTDWRGAGVVIPLFSLHSEKSAGIGDFGDLRKFVMWAAKVGFSCVQLLPINDTTTLGTRKDSYPYNIISAFALNPIYIDLNPLVKCDKTINETYKCKIEKLNNGNSVDFETVFKFKNKILKAVFNKIGDKVLSGKEAKKFMSDNDDWLFAFAAYCSLRDKYKSVVFSNWKGYELFDREKIEQNRPLMKQMQYYFFTQYVAYRQMNDVQHYAGINGIILKGDIPIGVNVYSAEVWKNSKYFNCNMSTGAPPDYFSADGQNWGFPTYNWKAFAHDKYSWWTRRFKFMSQFFHAYRIDHVLGFFRIWEIPHPERSAKKGHFSPALPYSIKEIEKRNFDILPEHIGTLFLPDKNNEAALHIAIDAYNEIQYKKLSQEQKKAFDLLYNDFFFERHNDFWADEATKKLRIITSATDMLPCAEDLGMLPSNVGKILNELVILSLEIQSMPKQPGAEFADTSKYPYRSVATLTTHDMPSFRLWWKKYPENARRYANIVLQMPYGEANEQLCENVVRTHLSSPSMLCLLSIQDWTSICNETRSKSVDNEQINDPANPNQYWNYKCHLSIEKLNNCNDLKVKIRTLIDEYDRNLFGRHFVEKL